MVSSFTIFTGFNAFSFCIKTGSSFSVISPVSVITPSFTAATTLLWSLRASANAALIVASSSEKSEQVELLQFDLLLTLHFSQEQQVSAAALAASSSTVPER